ncbi:MAG: DUF6986 family protein [Nocardioidaceae bacterium]
MSIDDLAARLDAHLERADTALAAAYPGERAGRQPVHTVYVPADRFDPGTVPTWGREALAAVAAHPQAWAALGVADDVADRVRAKLEVAPVEDLRVDFEDGYGTRPDAEEDAAAVAAATALAATVHDGTAAPFHGIRFKSFEAPTRRRGLRTLDLVMAELVARDALTDGFVVTLPKVTSVEQVEAMVLACEHLEGQHRIPAGRLRFEIQVETPQAVLGPDGTALVARMVHASGGRCTGLHYGTYDYSASCGIAAAYQSLEHPVADHAKAVMQVATAGTGVRVCDGSTNVLPVGDAAAVGRAWQLHARLVRRSLERGFYQGWDLHPAQLPTRYAATYAFYRGGLADATGRLRAYLGRVGSGYLDEPATAAALAGFVLRGVDCGAVDEGEAGLDPDELARLARRPARCR